MTTTQFWTRLPRWTTVLLAVLMAGGFVLVFPAPTRAANVIVNSTADTTTNCSVSGTVCLREAIAAAGSGGTVTFAPGVTGTILLNRGTMVVLNPATIIGPGSGLLTVDAHSGVRVFSVPAIGSSAISGLTITGGNSSTDGGGLYVGGAMTLTDVTVRGNIASGTPLSGYGRGGGIFVDTAGTLAVDHSTIGGPTSVDTNTSNGNGGGGIFLNYDASMTMTDSTVRGNTSYGNGGGICISGPVSGTNGTTITGSVIAGNSISSTSNYGGGISVAGPLTVDSSTIGGANDGDGNSAPGGGGIFVNGGGALRTVQNGSVIRGNTASTYGGGIYATGPTTITGSTLAGNSAGTLGGGLYTFYRPAIIIDASTIGGPETDDANTAPSGGGIYIDDTGPLTVRNGSVVQGNHAASGNGGGMYVTGLTTLTSSTMTGNSATGAGGGVLASGTRTMVNTTASANSSPSGGSGIRASGAATIVAATLTLNTGSPAILSSGAAAHTVVGSIDAGNPGGDALGGFADGGGNILSGNPLLAALGNYGGPITVPTHALLLNSPALDTQATCPTDPTTGLPLAADARGISRPQGGQCDSGAFESQGFTLTGNGDQSAPLTQPFPNPLSVTVAANDANVPVNSGTVTFSLTPGSATATFGTSGGTGCTVSPNLLSAVCLIGPDGVATTPPLTAGATTGTLTATASTGTGTPARFTLTTFVAPGQVQPAPSGTRQGPVTGGAVAPAPGPRAGGSTGGSPNPLPPGRP